MGVKTSRALDIKLIQALRYGPTQDITLFSAEFNVRRQEVIGYGLPVHAQNILDAVTMCQRGFKPFDESMTALSAYAAAAHDAFDSHSQNTSDLLAADRELHSVVTTAAAIARPDGSALATYTMMTMRPRT